MKKLRAVNAVVVGSRFESGGKIDKITFVKNAIPLEPKKPTLLLLSQLGETSSMCAYNVHVLRQLTE